MQREIANGKLYRSSKVSIIDEIEPDQATEGRRQELVALFRQVHEGEIDPDLDALFETELPLGVLADIITQAMGLSALSKQAYLAEPSVSRRVLSLVERLRSGKDAAHESTEARATFPPPFSRN